jgi:Phage replication protein CRI
MKKNKKSLVVLIDSIRAYSSDITDLGQLDDIDPIFSKGLKMTYEVGSFHFNVYLNSDSTVNTVNFFGSIPKYINGNNVKPITTKDIEWFIENIKDNIGIDISNFRITRLDISTWIQVKHPIKYYLKLMDTYPQYKRVRNSKTSIAFQTETGKKAFKFYDKHAELRTHKEFKTSNEFEHIKHMLRIEYMNDTYVQVDYKKDFKYGIRIKDLLSKRAHKTFKSTLIERFEKIKFRKTLHFGNLKNKDQVINYLIMSGIRRTGGLNKLNDKLKNLSLTSGLPENEIDKIRYALKKAESDSAVVEGSKDKLILQKLLRKVKTRV